MIKKSCNNCNIVTKKEKSNKIKGLGGNSTVTNSKNQFVTIVTKPHSVTNVTSCYKNKKQANSTKNLIKLRGYVKCYNVTNVTKKITMLALNYQTPKKHRKKK